MQGTGGVLMDDIEESLPHTQKVLEVQYSTYYRTNI